MNYETGLDPRLPLYKFFRLYSLPIYIVLGKRSRPPEKQWLQSQLLRGYLDFCSGLLTTTPGKKSPPFVTGLNLTCLNPTRLFLNNRLVQLNV